MQRQLGSDEGGQRWCQLFLQRIDDKTLEGLIVKYGMEYIGYTQYVADKRAVVPKYPKTPAVADVQRVAHQVWQVFAANRTMVQLPHPPFFPRASSACGLVTRRDRRTWQNKAFKVHWRSARWHHVAISLARADTRRADADADITETRCWRYQSDVPRTLRPVG